MIKKIISFIISVKLHFLAIAVIFLGWLPFARWYWEKSPILGIDFFNTVTYVKFVHDNFVPRFLSYKDFWFGGVPFSTDYPALHFYLMQALLPYFGFVKTVQIYMLGSVFLLSAFSYLLFWQVSRNRAVALVLALAVATSVGPYGALVWGGSLPFFATECFYPLAIYFLVRFLQSRNRKWFCLSILTTGLAIFGHPLVPIVYIFPSTVLLITFWTHDKTPFLAIKKKLLDITVFLVLSASLGFIEIRSLAGDSLGVGFGQLGGIFNLIAGKLVKTPLHSDLLVTSTQQVDERKFAMDQLGSIITQTNATIFALICIFAVLSILTIAIRRFRLRFFRMLPGVVLAVYLVFYISLYALGVPLFHGGWYRTFWAVPTIFGLLAAFLWGNIQEGVAERFSEILGRVKGIKFSTKFSLNCLILATGIFLLYFFSQVTFDKVNVNTLNQLPQALVDWRYDPFNAGIFTKYTISESSRRSIASSAFPDILNVKNSDSELESIKSQLLPPWMDGKSKEYRMYSIDATLNIWWNALFDIPLARGYIDPPLNTAHRWGLFWLDSAMGVGKESTQSSLMVDWDTPEDVTLNNTKFLLDWNAVKYFEGNHLSTGNSFLASNVTSDEFIDQKASATSSGSIDRSIAIGGTETFNEQATQTLNYFKLKDELTSPILSPNNAPAVLLIGDDQAFDSLTRFLGMMNLNSQQFVLAKGDKYIDHQSLGELKSFDAVILYGYDYKNAGKAWQLIEKYLEGGGKVYIDTGGEVKEANSKDLPLAMPFKTSLREDLGKDWQVDVSSDALLGDIKSDEFSPLDFDGKAWNVSHPLSDSDLRTGAEVVLRNKGFPVLVRQKALGGELIWSGFNMPYHIIREYNPEEAKLFYNILDELVNLKNVPAKGDFQVKRYSPQKIEISGFMAKGVIFKEEVYPGWHARLSSGATTKIYPTGPSYPGFMYVPAKDSSKVTFEYQGAGDAWFYMGLSSFIAFVLIDNIVFNQLIFGGIFKLFALAHKKWVRKWWEKDDYDQV